MTPNPHAARVGETMDREQIEKIEALLVAAKRHGLTLTNGGSDTPTAQAVALYDAEGPEIVGWNLWVADGQVCAYVPRWPQTTGEASDGDDLSDWRDAICAADWRDAICAAGSLLLNLRTVAREALDALAAATARAERAERILAVERGDEAAAPSGWERSDVKRTDHLDDEHPHAGFATATDDHVLSVLRADPGEWHWFVFERPDFMQYLPAALVTRGVRPSALEAMEAADAARSEVPDAR